MQMRELARRLIKAEDFDAVRVSLDDVDISIYSPAKVYVWQSGRYRSLIFFDEDKKSVFKALSELGVDKYTHPAGGTFGYSFDEIYKLMFREDAAEISIKIEDPGSIFFDAKIEVDRKIRDFVAKIEHATGILGEEFLNVKHYETRLKDVMKKMKRFLKKEALK